jgi:hypothetical protein
MKSKILSTVMMIVVAVVLGNQTGSQLSSLQGDETQTQDSVSTRRNGLPTPPQAGGGPACAPSGAGCGSGG